MFESGKTYTFSEAINAVSTRTHIAVCLSESRLGNSLLLSMCHDRGSHIM